jgi:S1-C subfamily serine protease
MNLLAFNAFAAGVAVFKEQNFHGDASATPIAYVQIVEQGGPFIKLVTDKGVQTIDTTKFVARVGVLTAMPEEIGNEEQMAPIRRSLAEITTFANRFPKSAPLLQQQITALKGHVANFDDGKRRYNGEWIEKGDYAVIEAKNREKLADDKRIELEKFEQKRILRQKEEAYATAQRAKGLERHGEKWLPVAEVAELRKRDAEFSQNTQRQEPGEKPSANISAPAWLPQSKADVADCSLFVKVTKGLAVDGSITAWNGTGFLCNHGSSTYIYSNAHNFDGASEFTIEDKYGNKYDDFISIETAASGHALWKESGNGGDVVRIRLRKFREKALTLDPKPVTKENAIKRNILVTGNTGGHGVITELEGSITDIVEEYIIKHNAATEGGNSGSPIVDLATYKVIGILTWGGRLPDALQAIWTKKPAEVREGIKTGAGLATVCFSQTSFEHLKRQRVIMNEMIKNVRLLGLLDTLIPTKQGLFVDKNVVVMGDYTVSDLLQESADHPVVNELVRLDQYLSSRAESNIGMNNQDMLKSYVACYGKCLEHITSLRRGLENSQNMTFFMKCRMTQSRMLEISKAYETLSARCLQWYVKQKGTSGQALPLAKRYRLPELRSGLEGLGIKGEH